MSLFRTLAPRRSTPISNINSTITPKHQHILHDLHYLRSRMKTRVQSAFARRSQRKSESPYLNRTKPATSGDCQGPRATNAVPPKPFNPGGNPPTSLRINLSADQRTFPVRVVRRSSVLLTVAAYAGVPPPPSAQTRSLSFATGHMHLIFPGGGTNAMVRLRSAWSRLRR